MAHAGSPVPGASTSACLPTRHLCHQRRGSLGTPPQNSCIFAPRSCPSGIHNCRIGDLASVPCLRDGPTLSSVCGLGNSEGMIHSVTLTASLVGKRTLENTIRVAYYVCFLQSSLLAPRILTIAVSIHGNTSLGRPQLGLGNISPGPTMSLP